jgi:hypothetical protein
VFFLSTWMAFNREQSKLSKYYRARCNSCAYSWLIWKWTCTTSMHWCLILKIKMRAIWRVWKFRCEYQVWSENRATLRTYVWFLVKENSLDDFIFGSKSDKYIYEPCNAIKV